MIIKGKSIGHARKYARHLMRQGDGKHENDRVEILELDESHAEPTIEAAFLEYQLLAKKLTGATYGMYRVEMNPQKNETLTREQWDKAIEILETELGLTAQPRVVVLHEKKGREHVHVVWSRTLTDEGKVVDFDGNYEKHEIAARKIEQEFDLKRTIGVFTREKNEDRPHRSMSAAEHQQGLRRGLLLPDIQKDLVPLYEKARTGTEFITSMEALGYDIARGNNNKFAVVDPTGGEYRLSSAIKGHKANDVYKKLFPLIPEKLATAKEIKQARERARESGDRGETLRKEYDKKEKLQQAQFTLEMKRLRVSHRIENELAQALRQSITHKSYYKALLAISGYSWAEGKSHERQIRIKRAQQHNEVQQLKQDHKNQRESLEQKRQKEFNQLAQDGREAHKKLAQFEVGREETKLNILKEQLKQLKKFDDANKELDDINHWLLEEKHKRDEIDAEKYHLSDLENKTKINIEYLFKDKEQVFNTYQEIVNGDYSKEELSELLKNPRTLGELKYSSKDRTNKKSQEKVIDDTVKNIKKAIFINSKIEKQESELQDEQTMAFLNEKKLNMVNDNLDDPQRLAKMRLVQEAAAIGLNDKQWKNLSYNQRHEIKQAREILNDPKKRKKADEILREKQDTTLERLNQLERTKRRDRFNLPSRNNPEDYEI